MKPRRAPWLLFFVAVLVACLPRLSGAMEPAHQSQPEGVLAGSVSEGPLAPHEPARALQRRPVAGVPIDIATADNHPVTSVTTDSSGNFKVGLAPGRYQVTLRAANGARPRNMPADIIIDAGAEKRLEIFLDTGLR